MTGDDIKLFLPIVTSIIATIIGGLTWAAKYFVGQIARKDEQLLKSLEVQQQSTTNSTVAIQQAAQASTEVRAVLEKITANQATMQRALDEILLRESGSVRRRANP